MFDRARELYRRAAAFARRHDLVPHHPKPRSIRASLPRHWLHWLSALVLLALFINYGLAWFGAGVLLVFLMIHTPFVINRIAGGFSRNFGFPCFALWIAGALGGSDWVRYAAVVLGAAGYPPIGGILLGAEGVFLLRDGV